MGMLPETLLELEMKLCFTQAGPILLEESSGEERVSSFTHWSFGA